MKNKTLGSTPVENKTEHNELNETTVIPKPSTTKPSGQIIWN